MTIIHAPKNTQTRIESVYAFLSEDDGGEGLCGANVGGQWMPLITADPKVLDKLRHIAKQVAEMTGKKIKLVKFTTREEQSYV